MEGDMYSMYSTVDSGKFLKLNKLLQEQLYTVDHVHHSLIKRVIDIINNRMVNSKHLFLLLEYMVDLNIIVL